jgi:hypothetical protein
MRLPHTAALLHTGGSAVHFPTQQAGGMHRFRMAINQWAVAGALPLDR